MVLFEILHKAKRKLIRCYQKYFTVDYPETYILSDKRFIEKIYEKRMGKRINLKNPQTLCEKENWLKLYDRKPEYSMMVDKYAVRQYIAELIGPEYLVPLLGVWDKAEDIDFTLLPERFVLKCNHNSDVTICLDKSKLDVDAVREKLKEQVKQDYYLRKREWPYKNVRRKILCEKYMENSYGQKLVDYKVFCFNGVPRFVMVNSNRFGEGLVHVDMYDMEWQYLQMQDGHYPNAGNIFSKPSCFDEIIRISKKLSSGIPFLRVDFNYWDERLYFGELTFFHSAGLESFTPEIWDTILGEWLILPKQRGLYGKNK